MENTGPFIGIAAFCENVIEDKQGVISLIRIVDRFTVSIRGVSAPEQMPPTPLNWFLVIMLKSGQARGSVAVKIQPELPSGLKMDPVTYTPYFEGGSRGCNIISRLGLILTEPGVYRFHIYIADTLATQVPLEVIYSRTVIPGIQPPH